MRTGRRGCQAAGFLLVLWLAFRLAGPGSAQTAPQAFRFVEHRIQDLGPERIEGCALDSTRLITWGDRLLAFSVPQGKRRVLGSGGKRGYTEGGCLMDVDGDGQPDLVVNEGPPERALVWFGAPRWTRHVIDSGIDAADVIPATLFGRRGVLLVDRRTQVRFYQVPQTPGQRWASRDIYSFYTPSEEGGLALADVDGDGRADILCGNYWIQSPPSFELPWRLFAIQTWFELPKSALLRLAVADLFGTGALDLIAAQREMPHQARLAWFEKPADPQQQWPEHRLENALDLNAPHSLDVADFDGDGRPDILAAEQGAPGRLIVFRNEDARRFTPHIIADRVAARHARAIDWNGDRRPDILTVSRGAISWWENRAP